jgi:sarcosine oxidase delta subunit
MVKIHLVLFRRIYVPTVKYVMPEVETRWHHILGGDRHLQHQRIFETAKILDVRTAAISPPA